MCLKYQEVAALNIIQLFDSRHPNQTSITHRAKPNDGMLENVHPTFSSMCDRCLTQMSKILKGC